MTIHAAFHVENASLANSLHFFNLSVAGLASYIGRYVSLVSEIHKIRQIVDLDPGDRLFRFPVADQLLDLRLLSADVLVAAHAKLHGRHTRDNRFARIDVTVEAVDLEVARMSLVTEINWLDGRGVAGVERENGDQYG